MHHRQDFTARPARPGQVRTTTVVVPATRAWVSGQRAPVSQRTRGLLVAVAMVAATVFAGNLRASGATAGITFRSGSASSSTTSSLSIARPSSVAAGDVLLASVTFRGTSALTAPVGWKLVRSDENTAVYSHVAGSSEPSSYVWNLTEAHASAGAVVAYTGVDGSAPVLASSGQVSHDTTSATAPSMTTSVDGAMLAGFFWASKNSTMTVPAGMTPRVQLSTSGTKATTLQAADVLQPSAGSTGAKSASLSVSGGSVAQLVALKPAPAPATQPSFGADALNSYSARLQWTLPDGTARVQVSRDGRLLDEFAAAGSGSYTDYLLWQSSTYSYDIKALDSAGTLIQKMTDPVTTPAQSGSFPRLFSSASPWNQRIGSNPVLDPGSAAMVSKALVPYASASNLNPGDAWGIPVAYANPQSQQYSVNCTRYDCNLNVTGRIPRYAQPSTGSDHHLAVIDPGTDTEVDMWLGARDAVADSWAAGSRYQPATNGSGSNCALGQHCHGSVASGFAVTGGLVRPEEIAQGHIDHALAITTPYTRADYIACPATASDGAYADSAALPEGALIQLDPSINVDAMPWPQWMKVVGHALQDYGAIVVDTGGSVSIHAESNLIRGYDAWGKLGISGTGYLNDLPWSQFRVLKLAQC